METIKDLFNLTNDYYITISLSDNYCLYIEGLNEDYVSLVNNFSIDNIKHLLIELNDYEGDIYVPIQIFTEMQDININTSIEKLKECVLDLAINKSTLID